jgi:hypothetical protein
MKTLITIITIALAHIACQAQINKTETLTDTIISRENLDDHVNKLITIKGEISRTKIPQILGIDVDCVNCEGKNGIATGILIKTIVLEKDVDPYSQNRGAGVFYRLKDPNSEYDAQVEIIEN